MVHLCQIKMCKYDMWYAFFALKMLWIVWYLQNVIHYFLSTKPTLLHKLCQIFSLFILCNTAANYYNNHVHLWHCNSHVIHLLSCWKFYLLVFSYLMLAFRLCTILYSIKLLVHKYDLSTCSFGKRSVHELKIVITFFVYFTSIVIEKY